IFGEIDSLHKARVSSSKIQPRMGCSVLRPSLPALVNDPRVTAILLGNIAPSPVRSDLRPRSP
ncbi:unnamed protein product, partial [Mycena citricolor]